MESRVVLPLAIIAAAALSAQQPQPAKPPTGIIRGRITASDGRPLRQAEVRVESANSGSRTAPTDAGGNYAIDSLAPDSYLVSASKQGFATVERGQRQLSYPGTRLRLGDGEVLTRIDLVLPRAGSLSGRVVDENGDPMQGVTVSLLSLKSSEGRTSPVNVMRSRPTDDLGRFRLFGIEPGDYIVESTAATSGPYWLPGYTRTFFPGVPSLADAERLTIRGGDDSPSIEISVLPGRGATVSGKAVDPRGEPYRGRVQLAGSERAGAFAAPAVQTMARPDGSFEFHGVGPGNYVVQTIDGVFQGGAFAHQFVRVADTDIAGLSLHAAPGSTVRGRMTLEGSPGRKAPKDFQFMFLQTDFDLGPPPGSYRARINDDWTFEYAGLYGPLLIRPFGGREWMLKSVRAAGVDITDTPTMFGEQDQSLFDVDVVLTNRGAEAAGVVTDARGEPVPACAVVIFPTDRGRWRRYSRFVKSSWCDADGTFAVRALPTSEYFVAALDHISGSDRAGEWQEPAFLEALSALATRAVLTEGQSTALSLRMHPR
jgi:hypothetical protein